MGAGHLLLMGAYGQRNLGDDALLEVFLTQLHGESLMVNSATPRATSERYGVATLPTYGLWPSPALMRGLLAAEAVVFGGGSLLKEIEGNWFARLRYLARILALLELTQRLGRPSAMLGVGMGPLHTPLFRRMARMAAERTSLICVRDQASADLLHAIGVQRPVHVTADPVYLLEPRGLAARRAGRVIIIPRYSLTPAECTALARACDHLVQCHGATLTIMPFQTGYRTQYDDLPVAQALRAQLSERTAAEIVVPTTTEEAMNLIREAELVVSARLHGLIFAALNGVAGLGLDYEPKMRGVMTDAGQVAFCVALPELTAGRLPAVLDTLWPRREQVGRALAAYARVARSGAARNFALFATLRPVAVTA